MKKLLIMISILFIGCNRETKVVKVEKVLTHQDTIKLILQPKFDKFSELRDSTELVYVTQIFKLQELYANAKVASVDPTISIKEFLREKKHAIKFYDTANESLHNEKRYQDSADKYSHLINY